MSDMPLPILIGQSFHHSDKKRYTYTNAMGRMHEFKDDEGRVLYVIDEETGEEVHPDTAWVLHAFMMETIRVSRPGDDGRDRVEDFLHLDMISCIDRDPKSLRRYLWGKLASEGNLPKNDQVIGPFRKATDLVKLLVQGKTIPLTPDMKQYEKQLRLLAHKPCTRRIMAYKDDYENMAEPSERSSTNVGAGRASLSFRSLLTS